MTFDTKNKQISKITLKFHPSYVSKKVFVYTKNERGGGWNTWKHVGEADADCNNEMVVQMNQFLCIKHETFLCLRFFNWTNGFVGVQRVNFEYNDNDMLVVPVVSDDDSEEPPAYDDDGYS